MIVDYDHASNRHTVIGARAALEVLFADSIPSSVLDVGCGTGTWLRAALDAGVRDVQGLDGVAIAEHLLLFPPEKYFQCDLRKPWSLGRRFDAVFCLEVAEHLHPEHAGMLVDQLTAHGDVVYFSAACPGQAGQNHVNCQWPAYWQELFNQRGFVCSDELRWRIWDDPRIEPWYRQNLFLAKNNFEIAGRETRIKAVLHPEVICSVPGSASSTNFEAACREIENGRMPVGWNLALPARALWAKLNRRLR